MRRRLYKARASLHELGLAIMPTFARHISCRLLPCQQGGDTLQMPCPIPAENACRGNLSEQGQSCLAERLGSSSLSCGFLALKEHAAVQRIAHDAVPALQPASSPSTVQTHLAHIRRLLHLGSRPLLDHGSSGISFRHVRHPSHGLLGPSDKTRDAGAIKDSVSAMHLLCKGDGQVLVVCSYSLHSTHRLRLQVCNEHTFTRSACAPERRMERAASTLAAAWGSARQASHSGRWACVRPSHTCAELLNFKKRGGSLTHLSSTFRACCPGPSKKSILCDYQVKMMHYTACLRHHQFCKEKQLGHCK